MTAPLHKPTRILHNLLALLVSAQLAIGALMHAPRPGEPPSTMFELHEVLGLTSLTTVAAFVVWVFVRRVDTPARQLFSWFGPARTRVLSQFAGLLRTLWQRRVPAPEATADFASAIHGLGLLAALGMSVSGGAYWVLSELLGDAGGGYAHPVAELHSALANLMWAYLGGHVFMVVVHQWLGHGTLRRILGSS